MSIDLDGLISEWERLEQAFHDALPSGQGETGDGGTAGRTLCQFIYDNSDELRETIRTLRAEKEADRLDAERWRALLGCARIRLLGAANVERTDPDNWVHLGLELWSIYDGYTEKDYDRRPRAVQAITALADDVIARQALTQGARRDG